MKVGVFGGTFDPVHIAHIMLANEVRESLTLDCIKLIPSYIPPHRSSPGGTPAQRLEMLQRAVAHEPYLETDDRELVRASVSYTFDSLASIRREIGSESLICFMLGSDAYALIDTWYKWQELTNLVHLVVLQRPGVGHEPSNQITAWAKKRTVNREFLLKNPAGGICFLPGRQMDISATEIRTRIDRGLDVSGLVSAEVKSLIEKFGLYRH